jgi:hypothetical protein
MQVRRVLPKCVPIGLGEYMFCNITQLIFKVYNNQPFNIREQMWSPGSNGSGTQLACVDLKCNNSSCINKCGSFHQSVREGDLLIDVK